LAVEREVDEVEVLAVYDEIDSGAALPKAGPWTMR
jgi:hypothetical protein